MTPAYEPTAAYGHVGRKPYKAPVELIRDGKTYTEDVQFFGWESVDCTDMITDAFRLE